jgi:hypothetical protein
VENYATKTRPYWRRIGLRWLALLTWWDTPKGVNWRDMRILLRFLYEFYPVEACSTRIREAGDNGKRDFLFPDTRFWYLSVWARTLLLFVW